MGGMVTITMATDCVWSFREVEGEEEVAAAVEVVAAAAAVVEVEEEEEGWDPRGDGTVPRLAAQRIGWSCQVGEEFLSIGFCVFKM